jgi:FAS-associated factor 2
MVPFNNNTPKIPEHTIFINNFKDSYGDVHPAFFQGSFLDAAQKSKNDFQFLIAYVHSPNHPNTDKFCK